MAAIPLHIDTIISDPNIRGGRPVIRGTSLRVADIVLSHTSGDMLSPEAIATNYRLSLGEVFAALAYYHLHKAEIDVEIRRDAEESEMLTQTLIEQGKGQRLE